MEYVYAALLLHKLGKEINEENISNVIKAAGGTVDEIRLKALVVALQGVNIDEAIRSATLATGVATAQPPTPAPPVEEKKEAAAKKEEEKKGEEEALAGLSALFG